MRQEISASVLRERLQSGGPLQLIDVRSEGEYAAGHVPTAANIPLEQIGPRLGDVSSNAPVVLICERGQRAMTAGDWLCQQRNVSVLAGGTRAWRDAGYPVVASVASAWSLERQVRFGAGAIVFVSSMLAWFVNPLWIFLAMFVGGGLTVAGLTGICPMGLALARLPWNRPKVDTGSESVSACCSNPGKLMKQ